MHNSEHAMRIAIRGTGVRLSSSEKTRLEERLHVCLGRFASRVDRVNVYLSDENGRKGGVDKTCRIVASLPGQSPVVIQDQDSNLLALLARSGDRLGRTIARRVEIERVLRPTGRRIMSISFDPEFRIGRQ